MGQILLMGNQRNYRIVYRPPGGGGGEGDSDMKMTDVLVVSFRGQNLYIVTAYTGVDGFICTGSSEMNIVTIIAVPFRIFSRKDMTLICLALFKIGTS